MGRAIAVFRWTGLVAAIAAVLAFPASAGALNAPGVFYAEGDVSSYEGNLPPSLWLALSGANVVTLAPAIGVQLQDSQSSGTAHPFKIEALSVPDGQPSQDPFYWGGGCIFAIGQLGQVGSLQQLHYEGPGLYTIRVTAYNQSDVPGQCASGGVATTVSFTISGRPSLRFTASKLLAGGPRFDSHGNEIGLNETDPPLASSELTVCALQAHVAADGSISGQHSFTSVGGISQTLFPAPGDWTCVARAFAGVNPTPSDPNPLRATAWSAPATASFLTNVSVVSAVRVADGKAPGFALAGKLNRAAAGGVLTLRLTPTHGCPRAVTKEVAHAKVRADGSYRILMKLAVKSSHRGKLDIALWKAAVSFGGNRLVHSNPHFGQLFLGRAVAFVPGIGFLKPPSERRLRLYDGGSCVDYA